jgi:MFS family permease
VSAVGAAAAPRPAAGLSAGLVTMMAVAMLINYADRGSLSVAAPVLTDQLKISSSQMGLLLSAFFWTYAAAHPLAGAIAQRFDVRWVMAIGLALWAGATALCGLAVSFAALLALRLLVGLGESVIYPANARVLSEHAPDHQRGGANGVILLGQFLGPTAGTLAGGLVLARFGWPWVFFALGGASLLWLIPWLTLRLGLPPGRERPAAARPPSYAALLSQRALWTASLAHFCYAYTHYLLLTWLPLYLVKGLHYSLAEMGLIGAAIFGVQSAGALASGWVSDQAIRRGTPAPLARKLTVLAGVAGVAISMGLVGVLPQAMVLPWLFVAGFCNGVASTMVFTIGQTLGGPTAGARWMGVQNMFGQFAGISAPIATGLLLERTGAFSITFLVASGLSAIGFLIWAFLVPRIQPVAWRSAD